MGPTDKNNHLYVEVGKSKLSKNLSTTTRVTRSQTSKVAAGDTGCKCSVANGANFLTTKRVTRSQALKTSALESQCKKVLKRRKRGRNRRTGKTKSQYKNKQSYSKKRKLRAETSSDIENGNEHFDEQDGSHETSTSVEIESAIKHVLQNPDITPPKSYHSIVSHSRNYLDNLNLVCRGQKTSITSKMGIKELLINNVAKLYPYMRSVPFDRLVTAMTWHSTCTSILAVASESGDILLWDTRKCYGNEELLRVKLGTSISSIKFCEDKPLSVYIALMTGNLFYQNLENKTCIDLLDGITWNRSFTSLDVSFKKKLLLAGDNSGYACLMNLEGEQVEKRVRLHKSKVTHIEFNQNDDYLVATASTDNTVKLWDLRMLSNGSKRYHCLTRLDHSKSVNSAYFSLANGSSLLTTSLDEDVKVYVGPLWHLETVISHPYPHLYHHTPIKANWHPLHDVIVMGRYPEVGLGSVNSRGIGFYDGHSGALLHQFLPTVIRGTVSYNSFNPTGELLASGKGGEVIIWKPSRNCDVHM